MSYREREGGKDRGRKEREGGRKKEAGQTYFKNTITIPRTERQEIIICRVLPFLQHTE